MRPDPTALRRLPLLAAGDLVNWALPLSVGARDGALEAAIEWLCRTHDVTGRQGSAKGYSLIYGWLPAYPETTGYVLGTLLEYARRTGGRDDLVARAVQMGDWEKVTQLPGGGIMEGHVQTRPRRPVVFNTGMVLHGWMDLIAAGHPGYEDAAGRAARFLVTNLGPDGTWPAEYEYGATAHTYNSRVAWAMLRWALHTGDAEAREAAARQLEWTCARQQANGWFDGCAFRPGMTPSTHAIAYTMRGLLESACLTQTESWREAVLRTAEVVAVELGRRRLLASAFDADWRPAARSSCLTGTVQLGGVLLRLHQETGEERWLGPGLRAVEQASGRQARGPGPAIAGALAGSYPAWGRYAPLQFPNWAAKFLADSLMVYDDCLTGSRTPGTGSVTPRGPGPDPRGRP